MRKTPSQRKAARAGVAYVLAMLYLILFTVLALGFCAASTMSVQIARNERAAADAQAAAESGMALVRYQLGQLPLKINPADDVNLAASVTAFLHRQLSDSAAVHPPESFSIGSPSYFPSENEWFTIDPKLGTRFRAAIVVDRGGVYVTVTGRGENETIRRSIRLQFKRAADSDEQSRQQDHLVADSGTYEEVSP